MTTPELLISRIMQKIEHTQLDNDLTDAEYNYFLNSILHRVSLILLNSASNALMNEEAMKNEIEGKVD